VTILSCQQQQRIYSTLQVHIWESYANATNFTLSSKLSESALWNRPRMSSISSLATVRWTELRLSVKNSQSGKLHRNDQQVVH